MMHRKPKTKNGFTPTLIVALLQSVFSFFRSTKIKSPNLYFLGNLKISNKNTTPRLVWGFTLVEILVSVAIFTVVMLVALGALLSILGANRKAQALKTAINNMNFSMESMTRTIRTGKDYSCDSTPNIGCPNSPGSTDIYLTDRDGVAVAYRLNSGGIERRLGSGAFTPLTSPDITINNLQFFVDGVTSGDEVQPRVLILLTGTAGVSTTASTTFTLQTLVTQRLIDR